MASGAAGEASPAAEHRTVGRVMSILELVLASEGRGMRLGDLSTAIDAPKSSVHGLAKGLVAVGYLREEDGRYLVGPAVSSLIAAGPATVQEAYHHTLVELTARFNETTMLATLVGDSVVYLDSVQSEAFIRATPELNRRLPLWPRSSGKCFLAFMEPRRLEAYLRRHFPDEAEASAVRKELEVVRRDRIGYNIGESVADHLGISVPIVPKKLPVTMAIGIVGPKLRMQDRVEEIAEHLHAAVAVLSG
jgi:DNA-binding IclR family transcriptional regulator